MDMKLKLFFEKYTEKPPSVFKRLFIIYFFGYIPFLFLHILLNTTGTIPVNFNSEPLFGLKAILVLVLFAPFIVLAFTILTYFWLLCGYLVLKGIKAVVV
jgi:hypothetical protein